ncbi:hypothetical protein [Streptomyces sp. AC602_WCS936]|uniref:hypothetical protein n=1 Tax=Streptomyces sp. AC602_WCS936 TaxID=2823685 RepID=UPI001C25173A|nr:hypothetical protein [Streptomyces sp. AC602_WCS936]
MSDAMRIVLDETAMSAVGQGNVLASRLIHRAHVEADWFLYVPACALVEADRARPGTAEHLASLPGITVLDLDLAAVLAVAGHRTWAAAHSLHAARPTADRPDGAVIATTDPDRWSGEAVRVLDLT